MAGESPIRARWLVFLLVISSESDALSISHPLPRGAANVSFACRNRKRSWQDRDKCSRGQFQSFRHVFGSSSISTRLYNTEDDEINSSKSSSDTSNRKKRDDGSNQPKMNEPKPNSTDETKPNILNIINPYNAGKSFRSKVESAFNLASAIASTTSSPAARLPPERRTIYYNYYLDDKLGLSMAELKDSTPEPSSSWSSHSDKDNRPEVLVVGATGALGRVLVKRLLLENKVRVRVLVRDLYSNTLNKLGTGVTYCQGDLGNMDSLEYAVTDLDKIIFCAGHESATDMENRSRGAEKVDGDGLRNLIHAYLNVRHADYGNSQTAKRVLFKFRATSADFDIFSIDDGRVDDDADIRVGDGIGYNKQSSSQSSWTENKFNHGVFTGQVSRYGEAAISSRRLRSRSDPSEGLDLRSGGFGGLVCRVCSNGGVYEAFLRTEAYERLGVEYVCEFRTASKSPSLDNDNSSRDKFLTVRLDFSDFRARMRPHAQEKTKRALGLSDIPPFTATDVRQIGFRYRGENNSFCRNAVSTAGWSKFYLALDYIKLYRGQPEPEFIYLSDARIPPVVQDRMVRDDVHKLVSSSESSNILDGGKMDRSAEETYFKYKGEEIIKQSGLR